MEFIIGIYKSLHGALDQAVKNDMLIKNVADNVILPKGKKSETEILTPTEQRKFIETAKNNYLGELFIFDLGTGLRIGEILALKWSEVDFNKNILTVASTLNVIKDFDDPNAKWHKSFGTPKTESSRRNIPLIPSVRKILENQILYQQSLKNEYGELFDNKENLVFTTKQGNPLDTRNMQKIFRRIIENAGLSRKKSTAYATRMSSSR